MLTAKELLNRQYHEMRGRILSLAADIDRIQAAKGGTEVLLQDARLISLLASTQQVLSKDAGRAERVQMILSDISPPPKR